MSKKLLGYFSIALSVVFIAFFPIKKLMNRRVSYKKNWNVLKEEMLESYVNYENQKFINKEMDIFKLLEGAQISLGSALDTMDDLDGKKKLKNLLIELHGTDFEFED